MILSFIHFFSRRYGTKCSGCGQGIAPSDLVRKPRDKVFHLNCFTCCICRKQLSTGEQLYVLDDNKFICKDDYLLGKGPHPSTMTGNVFSEQKNPPARWTKEYRHNAKWFIFLRATKSTPFSWPVWLWYGNRELRERGTKFMGTYL